MARHNKPTRASSKPHGNAGKARPKSQRKQGRPQGPQRVIGDREREEIARLVLQHWPLSRIAEKFGVDDSTIHHHVENHIRPVWQHGILRTAEQELARIDEIERVAWERFQASLEPETRETIKNELVKSTNGGRAKMQTVERVLQKITKIGDTGWMGVIQWCSAERSRICGYYAAHRLQIDAGTTRVAGKTREQVDDELFARIKYVAQTVMLRKQLSGPSVIDAEPISGE